MCTRAQFLSRVWFFAIPWTVDHQALLSMVLSTQARILEWAAISSPRGSSWPRIELLQLSHWLTDSLTLSHLGNHAMTGFLNPSWHLLVVSKNNKNNKKIMSLGKKEQEEIWHWNDTTKNRVPFPFHCFKYKKLFVSYEINYFSSVQFNRSVVSDSLWPQELPHTRLSCPSPTPGVHSNSGPLCWWCHQAISSSVVPFSSCPQSLPASESFPMSQLFAWDGQSIGVSALESVLPKNTQGLSPLEWIGWISLQSKGLSRVFSNTTVQKHHFFGAQLSSQSNSHIDTWPLEKP